jgi:peptide/nickel transport system ATP-binding protein
VTTIRDVLTRVGKASAVLEVTDLHTNFSTGRGLLARIRRRPATRIRAVDGVSLTLARGEILALVGESGCGKTTTVQTILKTVPSSAGSVRVNGAEITKLSTRELRSVRRTMQMVYQDPYESLDPRFRIRETIEEPLLVHRVGGTAIERRERVLEALNRVGLTPAEVYADRYPHELSGGQRQRVAIAAALVLEPDILLADEPVSMLDVSVRAGILTLLDSLRRERSMGILMITHDLSTAAHFADRIAVMYLGRIVEQGPARQVLRNPQHPYTQALLSAVPNPDPRSPATPQLLAGDPPNPGNVPSGCRFHPRCPLAETQCTAHDPQLRQPRDSDDADHQVACLLR